MPDRSGTDRFIRSAFRSIWSLELLLALRERPDHDWSRQELITALRASDQVISQSLADLLAAGLVVTDDQQGVRYAPASRDLDESVAMVAELYSIRPAAVRRTIVRGADDTVASFADAFRFRKE
jgi:DNA-binding GntR family transcriptional regulator